MERYGGQLKRNHESLRISGIVMRLIGSFISIKGISSRAPFERKLGRRYKPSREERTATRTLDLPEEGRDVLIIEGKASAEKRVENDARRPHVHLWTGIQASRNDLWRSVVWRATGRAEKVAIHQEVRKTKIGNLDVVVLVQ